MSFTVNGTLVSSSMGVKTATPVVSVDINHTDAIQLPSGLTSERPGAPAGGMMRYNSELSVVEYYNAITSSWAPLTSRIIATGGTVSDDVIGGVAYRLHTFTTPGAATFEVFSGVGLADVLIVGGGGAGGFGHGAGGAGGAVLSRADQVLSVGTYSIVVGSGGAQTNNDTQNNPGGSSSAFGVTATGGGSGANEWNDDISAPRGRGCGGNGANGGGGSYNSNHPTQPAVPGTGTAPSAPGFTVNAGFSGGFGQDNAIGSFVTGGGGGANATGGSGDKATSKSGDGGNGVLNAITGNSWYWGGGGGGCIYFNGTCGNGGLGGGGGGSGELAGGGSITAGLGGGSAINPGSNGAVAAASSFVAGGAAGANTGGGGGGGSNEIGPGGAGGSGIVIIRYMV